MPTAAHPPVETPREGPRPSLWRALRAWYRGHGRHLPWRRTDEPYAVLVSELMLQQTQAARVAEAWPRFLARFPDVATLAAVPTADVVEAWRGLGYNRRAVSLHQAAGLIVREHGGSVPRSVAELTALPGVGPYTARAVMVFAFGEPVAPVDTNIRRVLCRAVAGRPAAGGTLQQLADDVVPAQDAAAWSHALMDLGSRICTARAPRCGQCPIATSCAWRRAGWPAPDPGARGTSGQGRFEGSDRWHRGRLVDALRSGPMAPGGLADGAQLTGEATRLERIVDGLVADGLAEWRGGKLALPGPPDV